LLSAIKLFLKVGNNIRPCVNKNNINAGFEDIQVGIWTDT